jgi:flagellar biosynthesis/type III secretory pathway protein FliH
MTTQKQLQANRANARRSTGPKTETGKAVSRLNAVKHGLTAKTLIIAGESADDFDELRAKLVQELNPQSTLECELVEQLAVNVWRRRRAPCFEAAIVAAREEQVAQERREQERSVPGNHDAADPSDREQLVRLGDALIQDAAFGDALGKLNKREAHLIKEFTKAIEALAELRRSGIVMERPPAMLLQVVPTPSAA